MFHQTKIEAALGINIAISSKMEEAMKLWADMYANEPYWKDEEKGCLTIGLPAQIASELARLVTLEMVSEVSGSPRAEWINAQYQPVVNKARRFTEFACADGGLVLKPYVTEDGRISVAEVMARDFYPTSFDGDGDITGGVFVDYKFIGQYKYTRFEEHAYDNGTITIKNKAFRVRISEINANDETVGQEVPLTDVPDWENIQPEVVVRDVERVLFAYFKMPFANSVEARSPLGVSCYAKATDLIKKADELWSEISWEYEGGELLIHVADSILTRDNTGKPVLPKGKERLYEAFNFERGKEELREYHPEFRDSSLFNGLNKTLQRVEFSTGLAYGTLSDPNAVEKTATEINASRQRSYSTVSDVQKALQKALEHLLYAMDTMATLYNLAPAGEYEASWQWDDSIVVDSEVERTRDKEDVRDGIMAKWEYRKKWYGETEEKAKQMVGEAEGPTDDELLFGPDDMTEPPAGEGAAVPVAR